MYLFTRTRKIRPGSVVPGANWAVAATESVRKITGRDVDCWMTVLSPNAETVTWSMFADSMGDVIESGDKLATSDAWHDLVQRGLEHFDGPLVDGLANVLAGAPDLSADPPEYVNVVTATAEAGRLTEAVAGGIELASHAASVIGLTTMFAINVTGAYGGVAWITPTTDIATADAAELALMADAGWLGMVDRVGSAYQPVATRSLHRRIG